MKPDINRQMDKCCNACELIDMIPKLSDYDLDQVKMAAEGEQLSRQFCGVKRDS